jgi:hypothetical protein
MWTAKIAVLHYLRESHKIDQLVRIKKKAETALRKNTGIIRSLGAFASTM